MEEKKQRGGSRLGAGRKPRQVEQNLVGKLTEYSDEVFEVLYEAIKEKRQWAIKLWFERVYGKPTDYKQIDLRATEIQVPKIVFKKTEDL